MRVVDTSAWIEAITDTAVGNRLKAEIPAPDDCAVPTLVQHELAKWLAREQSPEDAEKLIAYTMTCQVIPLDTEIALRAAELGRTHGLSTADAIIYATALQLDADLLTCDGHFEGLAQVRYIAKREQPK